MARRFERTRRGVAARFDEDERALLAQLLEEVASLLDDGEAEPEDPLEAMLGLGGPTSAPEDPALARLLPDASRGDAEAAGEFRRLTERGLRSRKRAALATARQTLVRPGPLALDPEQARAWLTALTDVRLVLAARLDLRTDADAEALAELVATGATGAAGEDPRAWMASVYDFLTWLQEGLVGAMTERHRRDGDRPGAG